LRFQVLESLSSSSILISSMFGKVLEDIVLSHAVAPVPIHGHVVEDEYEVDGEEREHGQSELYSKADSPRVKKSSTSKPYEIYKDEVENDQMNLERIVNKVEVSNEHLFLLPIAKVYQLERLQIPCRIHFNVILQNVQS
jgi:hypothetical protein